VGGLENQAGEGPRSAYFVRIRNTIRSMETKKFIYYEEDGMFIGWLEEYPDYRTQGQTFDELQEHLREIYEDLTCGAIACVRRVGDLSIS
jgi:hypothetical protein